MPHTANGATFISKELEADSVKEKLEDTVEKFSKAEKPPATFDKAIPKKTTEKRVEPKGKGEGVAGETKAIDQAAKEVDTQPSPAQIEAGNYKKGHITIQGLEITIENPKGSIRKGVGKDGKPWETVMKHHYGYFKRTEGKDGDQVDVFIGDDISSDKVFIVNQVDPETNRFDEHKVMMGFLTDKQARVGYLANYERGWKGLGDIKEYSIDDFKAWLKEGDQKKKAPEAVESHDVEFMKGLRTKGQLDKVYKEQVKQLTERKDIAKDKRAKMLAEVIAAYKVESKKFPEVERETKEPLVLTPEKGTPWERQAELEREEAIERPTKGKKVKGEFGIKAVSGAGAVGRQQGLFGYEKGETTDMFAEAEEKAKREKKEAKVFVNTLDQVRADAKKGKKAGIEYVAQMEVAETGDIIDVPMDAGTALNEADTRLENYNKLLECIESD